MIGDKQYEGRLPKETWADSGVTVPTMYGCPPCTELDQLDAMVAFLGVPYDQGTSARPGARMGPDALRSTRTYPYRSFADGSLAGGFVDPDSREMRLRGVTMADCGNVLVVPANVDRNFARVTRTIRRIRSAGSLPVVLGGDHSITTAILAAYDDLDVIDIVHLDAHLDFNDEVQGQRWGHGAVIRRATEMEHVGHVTHVGIRSATVENLDDTIRLGNSVIGTERLRTEGATRALAGEADPYRPTFVTIDIDVLDPAVAPGTGTPAPGGVGYTEIRDVLRWVGEHRTVVGIDLVEVCPPFDNSAITALVAAQLLVDLLAVCVPVSSCAPGGLATIGAARSDHHPARDDR